MAGWIDITRTVSERTVHWPGDLGFSLLRVEQIHGDSGCNVSEIHTNAHMGTHIDAPLHFVEGGLDVASLPLSVLCGPATVVDIPERRDVTADDLAAAAIPAGDRVLLRTLNRHLWQLDDFDDTFTALTAGAARWLIEHGVVLIGIDYLSVDRFDTHPPIVHQTLLGAGIVVVEGVDLDCVKPGRYELVALPLKVAGGDGGPARLILRPMS